MIMTKSKLKQKQKTMMPKKPKHTIRRQWLIVLIITAVLTVVINSLVLSSLINRYFVDYSSQNYQKHLTQLQEYTTQVLKDTNSAKQYVSSQLETHLNDPITRIRLYDAHRQLVADVSGNINYRFQEMMRNRMMDRMMGNANEEIDIIPLTGKGVSLGSLYVTRYSSIGNSLETRNFRAALIGNSMLSFGVVLVLVVVIGILVSRRMSRELISTADFATSIDLGAQQDMKPSKVNEISTIQQSLQSLQVRLKLKQTSRKRLVDELVHQTRTPLTILKTHLEGIQDGVIEMTEDEIDTCSQQIENIEAIIGNMSGMIDAEKDIDDLKIEEVEIGQLLTQVSEGLRVQFEKKGIRLQLAEQDKESVATDRYKLSQCIYNILTNAYKYTESGGTVDIAYGRAGELLEIRISDTGCGINSRDQEHIFEAYYRGGRPDLVQGEGIGLFIVKQNLDRMNGTIQVEAKPFEGSTFIIRIPIKG